MSSPIPPITLYDFHGSPCARRVRVVLLEKGLGWETKLVDLTRMEQKRPEYLALNPNGVVPTLIHGDRVIYESNVITEYLDTVFPEPRLYPQDPRTRAMALILEDWADESLYWHVVYERWQVAEQFTKFAEVVFSPVPAAVRPMVKLLFARQTRGQLRGQGLGRLGVGEQREKFRAALDWLDSMVDGQFICGAELSIADVAVAAQVAALNIPFTPLAEAEVHAHAKVMRWLERTFDALG